MSEPDSKPVDTLPSPLKDKIVHRAHQQTMRYDIYPELAFSAAVHALVHFSGNALADRIGFKWNHDNGHGIGGTLAALTVEAAGMGLTYWTNKGIRQNGMEQLYKEQYHEPDTLVTSASELPDRLKRQTTLAAAGTGLGVSLAGAWGIIGAADRMSENWSEPAQNAAPWLLGAAVAGAGFALSRPIYQQFAKIRVNQAREDIAAFKKDTLPGYDAITLTSPPLSSERPNSNIQEPAMGGRVLSAEEPALYF